MSIEITINERTLCVEKGMTVLQAARENGIYIPTLCAYPGLPSHGSCRMCIVEIQGRPNTPTACTTPVEMGMIVQTDTARVQELRADLLKMLLSEHPSSCLFCPEKDHCEECMVTLRKAGVTTGCRSCAKDEQCELQAMVTKLGLTQANYMPRYRMLPPEQNDPFFDRDYNLCVLCGRCVRVCEDLHFSSVLAFTQRGTDSLVGTAFGRTHLEAGCTFCGACVEACPSGALTEKTRKWDGKPDGEIASTCPLCSLNCPLRILTKNGMVVGSLPDHAEGEQGAQGANNAGTLCVKGRFGITELVNHPTRLKKPVSLAGAESTELSWEETIQRAAEKLAACAPDQFKLIAGSACSREELYLADKFSREVMRAPRTSPTEDGALFGVSQPLGILADADTILCLGLDVQYAQSVVEVELHRAQKRGARLISLSALNNNVNAYADVWLRVQPGHEAEALRALATDASVLGQAERLVFVAGPSFLTPEAGEELVRLAHKTGARLVTLGARADHTWGVQDAQGAQGADVLYCIGAAPEEAFESQGTFVLHQNIYPPTLEPAHGLVLPAAAFTEQDGSLIDSSGRIHRMQKAVEPPGEALPGWQIICRIAQAMGAAGFDFASTAGIRAEMDALAADGWYSQSAPDGEECYLGFPLSRWVEGLQMLEGRGRV